MAPVAEYLKIRQYVIDLMRKHADHEVRIMSERELCRTFSVTRPTARKALKDLIDEGYLIARQGQGTFINPGMVQNQAYLLRNFFTVMLIMGDGNCADIDGFFMAIVERICNCFKSLPINLRFININSYETEAALTEIRMHSTDGILWVSPGKRSIKIIKELREKTLVHIIGEVPSGLAGHFTVDYREGGFIAANWFLEKGFRDVGFVGFSADSTIKQKFYDGWSAAYKAAGTKYDRKLIVDMKCDICKKVITFVEKKEVKGFFSFGSEFAAVDVALSQIGITSKDYPIVIDKNYYGEYGATITPTARIELFPSEITDSAALSLYSCMREKKAPPQESILTPVIVQ